MNPTECSIDFSEIEARPLLLRKHMSQAQYKLKDISGRFKEGEYNIRAPYQRPNRWNIDTKDKLIGTIMAKGPIPELLSYEYDEKNEEDNELMDGHFREEIIDGHHRTETIFQFMESKPIVLDDSSSESSREHMISWNFTQGSQTFHLFYKRTDENARWISKKPRDKQKNYCFFTETLRSQFDNYELRFVRIVERLTLEQRRDIFTCLQGGEDIKNSDKMKNLPSFERFEQSDFGELMLSFFFGHCTKQAHKYYTHWLCRLYEMFRVYKTRGDVMDAFLTKDSVYIKRAQKNSIVFDDETFGEFHEMFRKFMNLLRTLDKSVKFNPTQMFALFHHMFEYGEIIISKKKLKTFADNGKTEKDIWESKVAQPERIEYYREVRLNLDTLRNEALHKKRPRKKLSDTVCSTCGNPFDDTGSDISLHSECVENCDKSCVSSDLSEFPGCDFSVI
jgi:hypothetical protein